MSKATAWGILVSAGLLMGAAGCDNSPRPTAAQLQQGLNLLDVKDPSWGINAAYVKADRVIYLESRVGPLKPEVYRQSAPDDPQNEIDMRFVDENDNTFFVQRGGDNFVDPTWATDLARSRHAKIDPSKRELDFKMAQEAAGAFARLAPASLKDHRFIFKQFAAEPTPMQDPRLIARAADIAKQPPPAVNGDSGYSTYSNGDWDWLETDLYSGEVGCFAWICAYHSATQMWDYKWNNGSPSWNLAINACNHGRCYYDSGMSYQCYSNGGWFWNPSTSGENASEHSGGTSIWGACQTPYSWDTGGWNHLCNDDAAYELWQAKNGNSGTASYGTGGDGTHFQYYNNGNHHACDCGSFGGCDGDWQIPACP